MTLEQFRESGERMKLERSSRFPQATTVTTYEDRFKIYRVDTNLYIGYIPSLDATIESDSIYEVEEIYWKEKYSQ
jgi:hypothetical protein